MFAGFCVPKKLTAVLTRRGKQPSVRTEIHGFNIGSVTRQRSHFVARGNVPDLDSVVSSARSERLAVTTERHFAHTATMSPDRANLTTARNIPQPDLAHCFNLEIFHHVGRVGSLRTLLRSLPAHRATHHRGDVDIRFRLNSSGRQRAPVTAEGERCNRLAHGSRRHCSDNVSHHSRDISHVRHSRHLTWFKCRKGADNRGRSQVTQLAARLCVPERDLAHRSDNPENVAVRCELCVHGHVAANKRSQFTTGLNVPDLDLTAACKSYRGLGMWIVFWSVNDGEHRAIRTEAHSLDASRIPARLECLQLLSA